MGLANVVVATYLFRPFPAGLAATGLWDWKSIALSVLSFVLLQVLFAQILERARSPLGALAEPVCLLDPFLLNNPTWPEGVVLRSRGCPSGPHRSMKCAWASRPLQVGNTGSARDEAARPWRRLDSLVMA